MVKRILQFLGRVIVVALLAMAVINLPMLTVTTFENCMMADKGYMWVVNLLAAAIVAYTWGRIYTGNNATKIIGGIVLFLLMILVCETAIWHPTQFGKMMAERFSTRDLKVFGM